MVTEVAEKAYWKNQNAGEGPDDTKSVVPIKVVFVVSSCPPKANA